MTKTKPATFEEGRTYTANITLQRRTYILTYEDKGERGRSRDDILYVEGPQTMFFDKGLDMKLESGELDSMFFNRDTPPGYHSRGQEAYRSFMEMLMKKIGEGVKNDVATD